VFVSNLGDGLTRWLYATGRDIGKSSSNCFHRVFPLAFRRVLSNSFARGDTLWPFVAGSVRSG
jgi:hypothetical protein